jgi:hypothetical protein
MMQDINEKANIEKSIWIWQVPTVEGAAWDSAIGPDTDLDSLDCDI